MNDFKIQLIFEKSIEGRIGYNLPKLDIPEKNISDLIPEKFLRSELKLPELSEVDVVRHYTLLSQKNFGVDLGFYPLGSCTMKYNPKVNEYLAGLPGFTQLHPYEPAEFIQGALELIYLLESYLSEITGMDAFTLQPAAGAHGELTALLIAKAYFDYKKENRKIVLIPDSAHGTNPASAVIAGFEVIEVPSDKEGDVDFAKLDSLVNNQTAMLILTNPNTLGLFEKNILKIAEILHSKGALFYCDGANLNANLGIVKTGDLGFDLMHLNLHKTFSAPHGGGGPGSGPVGVKKELAPFLPVPRIKWEETSQHYILDEDYPISIGKVKAFYGNFLVLVRAYAYIRTLGAKGLKKVSQTAVLNANYLMKSLSEDYFIPYKRICQHEFVISLKKQKEKGVRAIDLAKRLLDFKIHAPTIYFPLIVEEALMIEPTETEGKDVLDYFIFVMKKISKEIEKEPQILKESPHNTPVKRLDEVLAARKLNLRWRGN